MRLPTLASLCVLATLSACADDGGSLAGGEEVGESDGSEDGGSEDGGSEDGGSEDGGSDDDGSNDSNSGFDSGEHQCETDADCPDGQICLIDTFATCVPAPACPGALAPRETIATGEELQAIAVVELDGDDSDELVVATPELARVYRFDGGEPTSSPWGSDRDIRALTVVRAQGPDMPAWLVAADASQGTLWIGSRGQGDDFSFVEERALSFIPERIVPVDLDGDGVEELLLTTTTEAALLGLEGPGLAGEEALAGGATAMEVPAGEILAVTEGGLCYGGLWTVEGGLLEPIGSFELHDGVSCRLVAGDVLPEIAGDELVAMADTEVLLGQRTDNFVTTVWTGTITPARVAEALVDFEASTGAALVTTIDEGVGTLNTMLMWTRDATFDCRNGVETTGRSVVGGRFGGDADVAVLTTAGPVELYATTTL